jgi:hypothetical protein
MLFHLHYLPELDPREMVEEIRRSLKAATTATTFLQLL